MRTGKILLFALTKVSPADFLQVTGGGGGIGRAISEKFLSEGKKVIICGRTESNLQKASQEMQNCPYYVLDTGNISGIPKFIDKITKEHSELDCLVNNAGVQRPLDVNEMSSEEFLQKADQEISINVNGPMHLAVGLLPHFKTKPGAVIMNVSSLLGYNPTSVINPVCFPAGEVPQVSGKSLTFLLGIQRHKVLCALLVHESAHAT